MISDRVWNKKGKRSSGTSSIDREKNETTWEDHMAKKKKATKKKATKKKASRKKK